MFPLSPAAATPLETIADRAPVTKIVGDARRIATPEGIEILEQVDVGDDRQWISIRGRNRANPVLLFVHGGPGTAMMPLNWAYQAPWEDYFTVVNWDQRGVGKNAAGADRQKLLPTLSLDRVVQDGAAVIDHVRTRLGKDKVVVLGFSWGSMVGAHLAHRFPDKVSAYVGVGQAVGPDDEAILYRETIAAAERAGDAAAAAELKALGPYPRANGELPLDVGSALRRYAARYDGMWYGHRDLKPMYDMAELAPEYSDADVAAFRQGSAWLSESRIMHDMMTDDLRRLGGFQVPVVLLLGRYDLATPYAAGRAWFETLKAPAKTLVTFERSSHFVMLEEPGRFLTALVSRVLPLTEGAPPYAVLPRASEKPR
ncbi:alpha/beta fold hydrolase [Sphingomonas colocasiae]|uniref:Alpha/beta hydrolase n=1 Tax=Sphingomonas colocasiae TaxID=1848973 RepID=A0ABS7PUJ8_9SPHN|nr:alpha/beta hydrolase [Sphingomonas colocasiae]MBY8825022.1 alpha/beta hydrolase [Sphingomonas colocasiae]